MQQHLASVFIQLEQRQFRVYNRSEDMLIVTDISILLYAFQLGFTIYIGLISVFTFVISKVNIFIVMSVWLISAACSVRSMRLSQSYQ